MADMSQVRNDTHAHPCGSIDRWRKWVKSTHSDQVQSSEQGSSMSAPAGHCFMQIYFEISPTFLLLFTLAPRASCKSRDTGGGFSLTPKPGIWKGRCWCISQCLSLCLKKQGKCPSISGDEKLGILVQINKRKGQGEQGGRGSWHVWGVKGR